MCVSDTRCEPQTHFTRQSTASQLPSGSTTGHRLNMNLTASLSSDGRPVELATSPGNDGLPSLTPTSSTASSAVLHQSCCPVAVVSPWTAPDTGDHDAADDDDDETKLKRIYQRHCDDCDDIDEEEDTDLKHT